MLVSHVGTARVAFAFTGSTSASCTIDNCTKYMHPCIHLEFTLYRQWRATRRSTRLDCESNATLFLFLFDRPAARIQLHCASSFVEYSFSFSFNIAANSAVAVRAALEQSLACRARGSGRTIGLFDRNFDCVCVCLHSPYRIRLVRASPARIFSRSVHAVPFAVFSYAQPLVYSYKCARDAASHCARSPFIRAFSWPAAFRPAFPHLQHLLSPLSLSLSLSRWPNVGFICALWSPGTRLPTTLLRSISYHLSISKLI